MKILQHHAFIIQINDSQFKKQRNISSHLLHNVEKINFIPMLIYYRVMFSSFDNVGMRLFMYMTQDFRSTF